MYEGVPIAIELPQRVTLEVVETEPTMKGQTASSSYKPAILSNGVRTLVPGHIVPGHADHRDDRRRRPTPSAPRTEFRRAGRLRELRKAPPAMLWSGA